eukprot:g5049.t1
MALLDLPLPYPAHVVEQRAPYASGFPGDSSSNGSTGSIGSNSSSGAATIPAEDTLGSRRGEMQTTSTSLTASASSGSLAPPPGLPRSSSTAELVALGFDPSSGVDANGNDLSISKDGSGGGGYDPRPPAPTLSNSVSGSGSMVGSTSGGGMDGGGEMGGGGGGGGGTGTGSAGGMGLGLRNHSLTNLANMVRSQSVSSFHSDIFATGSSAARMRSTAAESPAWGSYPANLDKMGGGAAGAAGDAFTTSPSMGPRGPGRGMASAMRPVAGGGGGGSGGGDGGGADLSPAQFAGRGTAARREVAERGVAGSSATAARASQSQRRSMGGGSGGGGSFDHRGAGPGGGAPTSHSGRAMVHNRRRPRPVGVAVTAVPAEAVGDTPEWICTCSKAASDGGTSGWGQEATWEAGSTAWPAPWAAR